VALKMVASIVPWMRNLDISSIDLTVNVN